MVYLMPSGVDRVIGVSSRRQGKDRECSTPRGGYSSPNYMPDLETRADPTDESFFVGASSYSQQRPRTLQP